jgi:hypothetical protein
VVVHVVERLSKRIKDFKASLSYIARPHLFIKEKLTELGASGSYL